MGRLVLFLILGLSQGSVNPVVAQSLFVGPEASPPRPQPLRPAPPMPEGSADTPLALPELFQQKASTQVRALTQGELVPCKLHMEQARLDDRRVPSVSPWSCRLVKERQEVWTVLFPGVATSGRPHPDRLKSVLVKVPLGDSPGRQRALVYPTNHPMPQRFGLPFRLTGEFGEAAN